MRPNQRRVKFTPELWDKWHADRTPNERTQELREGIRLFRALVGARELIDEAARRRR